MSENNPPADHVFPGNRSDGNAVEDNIKSKATWTRFLFMVICSILVWAASIVGGVVVVLGFLMLLFTGEVNRELRGVGQSLATYIYENIRYLTFNTEDRPFPFGGEWPSASTDEKSSD